MDGHPETPTPARNLSVEAPPADRSTNPELPGEAHDPLGTVSGRRKAGMGEGVRAASRFATARWESVVERFVPQATTIGFLLALLILVSIAAWMYRDTKDLIRAEDSAARGHDVLEMLGAGLLLDFVEAQAGRRGFVMTGDARELKRFQSAIDRIGGDLTALQKLTADNANQQRQLLTLRPLLARRLALWRESVALRQAQGVESERQRQLTQEGRELNDSIRAAIGVMESEERTLSEGRRLEARASAQYAMRFLMRGTLAGVVLLMIVFALLKREISQRTRMEHALRLRTAELEMANKELEAFSYSVSHDLRNPLGVVDGYSDALLTAYADKLDQTGKECLQRVRAVTAQMAQLIDDLLQFSLARRAELRHDAVDLSALAGTVVAELRQMDPERQVTVAITPGLTAAGDPGLLRVVLRNLLGNAWKFTAKSAAARIEFGAVDHRAPREPATYFVRDNGVGFDMAKADKLFAAFQRLHNVREFPGTGIGLATVQRIVQRHGGRVWAEGAVGKGATFYFTL
jgi:signal transduction histidine kinase